MRILLSVISILVSNFAIGNPIVVFEHGTYYDARKESENCIVLAGLEKSHVSCAIEYTLKKAKISEDSYYLHFALPIFVNSEQYITHEGMLEDLNPKIEMNGKTFKPNLSPARVTSQKDRTKYRVPEGIDLIFYHFTVDLGLNEKRVSILVSYDQPTFEGSFYYIPLFEDGRSNRTHRMDILPESNDISIHVSTPKKDTECFSNRSVVYLRDRRLVQTLIANQ